jgi:hypothetical protein
MLAESYLASDIHHSNIPNWLTYTAFHVEQPSRAGLFIIDLSGRCRKHLAFRALQQREKSLIARAVELRPKVVDQKYAASATNPPRELRLSQVKRDRKNLCLAARQRINRLTPLDQKQDITPMGAKLSGAESYIALEAFA